MFYIELIILIINNFKRILKEKVNPCPPAVQSNGGLFTWGGEIHSVGTPKYKLFNRKRKGSPPHQDFCGVPKYKLYNGKREEGPP